MADWSSLPRDLVALVGDCLLADDDIDYYIDFRAVCRHWRKSTIDPKVDGTDPRFQPKMWAVLKNYGYLTGSCVVSMVNLHTCRVLRKQIPKFHDYYFFTATDGGLLVLGQHSFPDYRAWVLNPLTGFKVCFTVPMFSVAADIKALAVTDTSPMRLFVSDLYTFVGWADPNAKHFQEYRVPFHRCHTSMKQVGGSVYVANRHGSIFATTTDDEGNSTTEMIKMTPTIIQADVEAWWEDDAPSYYLVECAGELLIVMSRRISDEGQLFVQVHKVDTERKVLEPVTSIGRCAIFISEVRSFVVDAFPTIEAGCIYFVDTTMNSLFNNGVIATSFRLADQRQEDIMDWDNRRGYRRMQSGPATLVVVLADYCRFVPTLEYELVHSDDEKGLEGFEWRHGSTDSDG